MTPDELFETWLSLSETLGVALDGDFEVEEELVPAFTRETGMDLLGCGVTRCVFALDEDRVIKLGADETWQANIFECQFWLQNKDDPARAKWLAPVLDCADDGSWLVMQRAEPVDRRCVSELISGPDRYELYGWAQDWMHPMQWGELPDGRMVLVDYGWPGGDAEALRQLKRRLMR